MLMYEWTGSQGTYRIDGDINILRISKVAIATCHADEMLNLLKTIVDLDEKEDIHKLSGGCECCGSWSSSTPIFQETMQRVRTLLAKLDGQP